MMPVYLLAPMMGPTTNSGTERPVQDRSGQNMRTGQVKRT
jgi:hypothetical protein